MKARTLSLASILRTAPLAAAALWASTAAAQAPMFPDSQVRYTVKVDSKQFGDVEQTRILRSGEVDDFTWKTIPPGGPVPVDPACPGLANLPLDANGAMIRQTQVRLAPVLAEVSAATIQLYFQAHAPQGTVMIRRARGKALKCPKDLTYSEIVRFDMKVDGRAKAIVLGDGTRVVVSASALH